MTERLLAHLHDWLADGPVVMASVLETRGATPRKGGSRMLVTDERCEGSIGGGLAEAQVVAAARELLAGWSRASTVEIDLTGRPDSAGICGGRMLVGLRRWSGALDRADIGGWRDRLAAGEGVDLTPAELGGGSGNQRLDPDVRLLIVGAGHCGLALYEMARHLDFELWVYDPRRECFGKGAYAEAIRLAGEPLRISLALQTRRKVFAVCLNRDFQGDVAALRVLCMMPPEFLGMMGSQRRIAEVRAALPEHAAVLSKLVAPVGLDIGAETPHEIAVSILAQLIARRRALQDA